MRDEVGLGLKLGGRGGDGMGELEVSRSSATVLVSKAVHMLQFSHIRRVARSRLGSSKVPGRCPLLILD